MEFFDNKIYMSFCRAPGEIQLSTSHEVFEISGLNTQVWPVKKVIIGSQVEADLIIDLTLITELFPQVETIEVRENVLVAGEKDKPLKVKRLELHGTRFIKDDIIIDVEELFAANTQLLWMHDAEDNHNLDFVVSNLGTLCEKLRVLVMHGQTIRTDLLIEFTQLEELEIKAELTNVKNLLEQVAGLPKLRVFNYLGNEIEESDEDSAASEASSSAEMEVDTESEGSGDSSFVEVVEEPDEEPISAADIVKGFPNLHELRFHCAKDFTPDTVIAFFAIESLDVVEIDVHCEERIHCRCSPSVLNLLNKYSIVGLDKINVREMEIYQRAKLPNTLVKLTTDTFNISGARNLEELTIAPNEENRITAQEIIDFVGARPSIKILRFNTEDLFESDIPTITRELSGQLEELYFNQEVPISRLLPATGLKVLGLLGGVNYIELEKLELLRELPHFETLILDEFPYSLDYILNPLVGHIKKLKIKRDNYFESDTYFQDYFQNINIEINYD